MQYYTKSNEILTLNNDGQLSAITHSRYKSFVVNLIEECKKHGFYLVRTNDGEMRFTGKKMFENILQTDEDHLTFTNDKDERMSFYCLYGNEIWETIADYGFSEATEKIADEVFNEISERFQNIYA
jgi:hypothetical protein